MTCKFTSHCVCMHVHTQHTHITCTQTQGRMHTFIHIYAHTPTANVLHTMHMDTHTHVGTHLHTMHMYPHTHVNTHTCAHWRLHTHTIHTFTYMGLHIRVPPYYTHMHAQPSAQHMHNTDVCLYMHAGVCSHCQHTHSAHVHTLTNPCTYRGTHTYAAFTHPHPGMQMSRKSPFLGCLP